MLAIFIISNLISAFAPNYTVLLIVRIIPAFLHPVYFSVAFVAAANSVSKDQSTKAASKVFIGLSVGMVLGIPITSFIADQFTLEAAFIFSAAVNALAFIGIVALLPSMPVVEKLSYKKQLGILKKTSNLAKCGYRSFHTCSTRRTDPTKLESIDYANMPKVRPN